MKMFPYRIRLRVLMFIISIFYEVLESRKPILLPNSGQIIINKGEALNITCIGDGPIIFIPLNNYMRTVGPHKSDIITGWNNNFTQYNFYKKDTTFSDTGWYKCDDYFTNLEIPYYGIYSSEESWIYVYVKSNKNFFVGESNNIHLNAIVGGNVIIPCRTTSPDLKPILINGNNSSRRQIKVFKKEIDGKTLKVTSQLMIFNIQEKDIGFYQCVVKVGQDIEKIRTRIDGRFIDPEMRIGFFSHDNFYKKKKSGENVVLKIKLHRLNKDPYFILLPLSGTFQWFNPNGEKIVECPKYYVKHKKNRFSVIETNYNITSSLLITELNIMDSGNYTLQIQNRNLIERKNFLLDVIGKPISSLIHTESYYSPNESTEFHCEIISNPLPNITWSFFKYPKYPSFENTTIVYLTNVTQRAAYNSSYKIESMVTMLIEVSGKIKCEACNTLGCDSKNEIILVSDGLGAFGIIGPRESVLKGDNVDLICAASVYNYMNNFMWTVRVNQTEKTVNETERLTVVQHRTPFTYRSTLKLNNVQKSDDQDYFCIGEIMNTSNQKILAPLSNRATYTLIIYDPIMPFFTETNLNRTKIRYIDVITEGHITVILQCFAKGVPIPTVTWYKDGVLLKESDQYLFKYNYQELHIKYMMPHDSGKYSCRAISRLSTNETYQQITVKDTTWYTLDIILVSSIPILGFILVIIAIFFTIKFHREKENERRIVGTRSYIF